MSKTGVNACFDAVTKRKAARPLKEYRMGNQDQNQNQNGQASKENAAASTAAEAASNDFIGILTAEIEAMMSRFIEGEEIDASLSGRERQRLFGAGVRNFGFIEKAWDIVRDNPQFVPPNFSWGKMERDIRSLEEVRQLNWVVRQFLQAVNERLLLKADVSFRGALRVYGSLREQAKSKVPGAETLYLALLAYFRHRRKPAAAELTEKELERDLLKLMQGKTAPNETAGIKKA
jgi:hypothetical protein